MDKTQVIFNEHVIPGPIVINGGPLEVVREYVYLGKTLKFGKNNFEKETDRRIQLGCAAFGKLRWVFSLRIPQSLKNQCVLLVTYGAETWTLTGRLVHK